MSHKVVTMLVVLILVTACQTSNPTTTSVPPTETSIPPTVAPTETPAPSPTAHVPEPTATEIATATPPDNGPVVSLVDEVTIPDGESFAPLALDDYVSDLDHSVDEITWSFSGNVELGGKLARRILTMTPPTVAWVGSETIHVQACDPTGQCDAGEITFIVIDENDPPLVSDIDDQVIFADENFVEIVLDEYVDDSDNADQEITWSYSENVDLGVQITDRVVTVSLPDESWRGPETVRLQACDPQGQCDAAEAVFLVQDDADLKIIHTDNSGFLISAGEKKVMIDSLFSGGKYYDPYSQTEIRQLENATSPFNDVDLILATHTHADHFSPDMVGKHLENNPNGIFLSTDQAASRIRSEVAGVEDRAIGITLERGEQHAMVVNGIGLEIFRLPHGVAQNFGFIISIGGFRIFHAGGFSGGVETLAVFQDYGLPSRQVDVAFMPLGWFTTPDLQHFVQETIQAQYVVPMHPGALKSDPTIEMIKANFARAVIFKAQMDSWDLHSAQQTAVE
ncbi:MAG: hypothetical protein GY832_47330 [Chloroflexi bacterium]|nr:hypothetical protein [Chloroflexota bacterium]